MGLGYPGDLNEGVSTKSFYSNNNKNVFMNVVYRKIWWHFVTNGCGVHQVGNKIHNTLKS